MKLRNLANRLLAIGCVLWCSLWCGVLPVVTDTIVLHPAGANDATVTAPRYLVNQYNAHSATDTVFKDLGVLDFNQYLMETSATQPLNKVVVAVIDSGLDWEHVCFDPARIATGACNLYLRKQDSRNYISSTGFDVNDWNVDENGHGTHVAGIIADGSPSNVEILPIRVFGGANNDLGYHAFEDAIDYVVALKNGERKKLSDGKYYNSSKTKLNIVAANLSLGTAGILESETTNFRNTQNQYQPHINKLFNAGILPVVAAGNIDSTVGENNEKSYYSFPAACNGTVAVSAYDYSDTDYYQTNGDYPLASFSYHNKSISLSAPGAGIWSACPSPISSQLDTWETQGDTYGRLRKTDQAGEYYVYGTWVDTLHKRMAVKHVIRFDAQGNVYLRLDGTSMATPFVTLCYALLMSDPTRTGTDHDATALGLASWDPSVDRASPYYYLNPQHKALLLAANKYRDYGETGVDEIYGYGAVYLGGFVPKKATAPETGGESGANGEGGGNGESGGNETNPGTQPSQPTQPTQPSQPDNDVLNDKTQDELLNKPVGNVPTPTSDPDEPVDEDWAAAVWILVGIGLVAIAICSLRSHHDHRRGDK